MSDYPNTTKRTKQISSLKGWKHRPWRQISILLVSVLLMVGVVQVVFGIAINWTTVPRTAPTSGTGWDPTVPAPGTQTFDLGGGISMDVSYNAEMWDGVPAIYGPFPTAPVTQLEESLRWTNSNDPDPSHIPAQMIVEFSEPVYLNNFTVGSLSYLEDQFGYEWVDVQAFDQSNVLLTATNYSGITYEVDSAGNYITTASFPGSPFVVDDGTGLYYVRGTSGQPPEQSVGACNPQCGYDMANFEYAAIPVKRIEVQFWIRVTPGDPEDPTSGVYDTVQGSIVLDAFDFTEAQLDWGDLPDTSGGTGPGDYETLAVEIGPYHVIDGSTYLGSCVDVDSDGQQNGNATGDDVNSSTEIGTCIGGDDEDGVFPTGNWSDSIAEINVTSSTNACLNIWLDYTDGGNGSPDGNFSPSEYVLANQAVNPGLNNLTFAFPGPANDNVTYFLRARLTPQDGGGGCTGLDTYPGGVPIPTGAAIGGEVEDYQLNFGPTAIRLNQLASSSLTETPWIFMIIAGMLTLVTLVTVPRLRKE